MSKKNLVEKAEVKPALPLDELVGKPETDAIAMITKAGLKHRVVNRDGDYFMTTMDYDLSRVNLAVTGNMVQNAHLG